MEKRSRTPFLFLLFTLLMSGFCLASTEAVEAVKESPIDSGDTAWMLTSTLLVLLMCVPGLALFYGGLVRGKNVLSIMVQCFACCGVMSLIWVVFGYAVAAGDSQLGGLFGWKSEFVLFDHISQEHDRANGSIPESVWVTFQMTFIMIAPALIIGAFAERMKFSAMMVFTVIWVIFSYLPIWHMAWGGGLFHSEDGNWLMSAGQGAIDFAGGNVVHINAGIAGLIACIMVGPRKGFNKSPLVPHNVVYVVIGAALLWVGWFGFNAGSAASAGAGAGMAMLTTQIAAATAVTVWLIIELIIHKKPTAIGAVTGAVAGLVAITPAAGSSSIVGAIAIGGISSACCYLFATKIKHALGYDDSLDVFGVHGIGGIVGALLSGVFIYKGHADFTAGLEQFWVQAKSVIVTIGWSAIVSFIALIIAKALCGGLRVDEDEERLGLDLNTHGEEAYNSES